jgi:hypothetical protein
VCGHACDWLRHLRADKQQVQLAALHGDAMRKRESSPRRRSIACARSGKGTTLSLVAQIHALY